METNQKPDTKVELDDTQLDQVAGGLTRWRCNSCRAAMYAQHDVCPHCQSTDITPYEGNLSAKFA